MEKYRLNVADFNTASMLYAMAVQHVYQKTVESIKLYDSILKGYRMAYERWGVIYDNMRYGKINLIQSRVHV